MSFIFLEKSFNICVGPMKWSGSEISMQYYLNPPNTSCISGLHYIYKYYPTLTITNLNPVFCSLHDALSKSPQGQVSCMCQEL